MPEHAEDEGVEELYVVLRGRARFEIDGDTVDAPAGALMFVGPETSRTAFAVDAETTVLAVGSRVGKPYEAGGWEVWAEFHPAYEAGDYEGVIERGRSTLETAGYATPLYNLACCEARPAEPRTRSIIFGMPSSGGRASATWPRRTPTSTRSGTSRHSASSSASQPPRGPDERALSASTGPLSSDIAFRASRHPKGRASRRVRYPVAAEERWQSGRMRRSRKPLSVLTADRGFKSLPLRSTSRNPLPRRVSSFVGRLSRPRRLTFAAVASAHRGLRPKRVRLPVDLDSLPAR